MHIQMSMYKTQLVGHYEADTHIECLFSKRWRIWGTIGGEPFIHCRSLAHCAGCGGLVIFVKWTVIDRGGGKKHLAKNVIDL